MLQVFELACLELYISRWGVNAIPFVDQNIKGEKI